MTRSRRRKLQRAGAALASVPLGTAAAFIGIPVAYAQAQPDKSVEAPSSGGLEEVVVTAQKRAENLQKVPVSIQALSAAKLEELHVDSFNDYAKFLPSVAYQSLGPGFARVYMRGVAAGDNGNHSGSVPSVGMYLDEQPITTITGALDIHVYDIARVESLSGPQGTLYGASSQAGTIRIITNKPDTSGFKAGYNLEGNTVANGTLGYVAEGFVNLPVSDTTAVRLVGWAQHDSGYIDNVRGTRTYPTSGITINNYARAKDHYNDVDTYGARAALKVDLNDSWTITPTIMGQEQKTNGLFAYDPNVGELKVTHFLPENSRDRWGQAALTIEGKISDFDLVYAGAYMQRKVHTESDYSDYSFFYDTAYGSYITDNAGNLINPSQYLTGNDRYTKQSHELRISSPRERRLRFVGGLFMQRQVHNIEQRYQIQNLATAISVPGWPDTLWLTEQIRTDRDYAAFGELTYDLTAQLKVTGGIRFFKAKNSLEGFYGFSSNFGGTGVAQCFRSPGVNGGPCTNLDKTVNETGNTPRLNLTYQIDDQRMVYATYSEGFRPGGVNRRGTFPPYKADFLKNYEIGWKTSWADNSVRINGAVFQEDWKDFQYSFLGANGLTNVTNAGGAQIRGVEADIDWAVDEHLLLSGGISLLDSKLTQFFCLRLDAAGKPLPEGVCASEDSAPANTQLPITPRFKGNLTLRYSFNVASYAAHLQSSFVYQSSSRSALLPYDASILGPQDAYGLVDLSATFERGNYSLELFANNAFNKHAVSYRYAECAIGACGPQPYIVTNQPRLIGIRFGQKF